jgi:putative peptidoglycan lipid II flippase
MSFLVSPTLVGYLALGVGVVGAVYRHGAFDLEDNWLVFLVLAAYSLGLLASSASRLLQSVFFSFGDTRSPARIVLIRLVIAAGLGAGLMLVLDRVAVADLRPPGWLGPAVAEAPDGLRLGAVGLALGSAVGSWFELALLLRGLRRRNAQVRPWRAWGRHLPLAALCLSPWAATQTLVPGPPWIAGVVPVVGFAVTYLGAANVLKVPEALALRRWLIETRRRPST